MFAAPVYVLVLKGNEDRHAVQATKFVDFLVNEVGLPSKRICHPNGMSSKEETNYAIDRFFDSLPKVGSSDVVAVYSGHGNTGVMFPQGNPIDYDSFAKRFDFSGRFIFINSSCNSGSCIEAFQSKGLIDKRGLIITSSKMDEDTRPYLLLNTVIYRYRKGESFHEDVLGYRTEVLDLSQPNLKGKSRLDKEIIRWRPIQSQLGFNPQHYPMRVGEDLDHILFAK